MGFPPSTTACMLASGNEASRMNTYFRRQLTDYIEYHRNWWNGVMHVFGIISLFLAAILPLSMWPVPIFGAPTTAATIAVLPVLIYWLLLDAALGTGILVAAILLLSAAAMIVDHVTATSVWLMTATFGDVTVSSTPNARPATSGMPSVSKK